MMCTEAPGVRQQMQFEPFKPFKQFIQFIHSFGTKVANL